MTNSGTLAPIASLILRGLFLVGFRSPPSEGESWKFYEKLADVNFVKKCRSEQGEQRTSRQSCCPAGGVQRWSDFAHVHGSYDIISA